MTDTKTTRTQKRDMTQGSILRHILRMAVPMLIGIGAIISFSLVDTYFISQLGTKELAAIGYTFPITNLYFNLVFGMAIAMSAVISRTIGKKDMQDVRQIATIGLAMIVIFAASLSCIMLIFSDRIFTFMGAEGDVLRLVRSYMDIWLIGGIPLAVSIIGNSVIRGMGDAIPQTIIMVSMVIVNCILDPILIFGLFGAPALGMEGAAYASITAYFFAVTASLSILVIREGAITLPALLSRKEWSVAAKALLVIAIPVGLANSIGPLVGYGYTAFLSDVSREAVAGFAVIGGFQALSLIPIMALSGGISPLIGQNYGAGLQDRINEALRLAMRFAVYYGLFCAALFAGLSFVIPQIFSDHVLVQNFIGAFLLITPLSFIGLNLFLVTTSAMNATERPRTALALNIMRSFIIDLPLAWILIGAYGTAGFLASIIITNSVSGVCALFYVKTLRCKAT